MSRNSKRRKRKKKRGGIKEEERKKERVYFPHKATNNSDFKAASKVNRPSMLATYDKDINRKY